MKILHVSVAGICDKFYLPFLQKMYAQFKIEQTIYIPYKTGAYSSAEMEILEKYELSGIMPIALPIKNISDRLLYKKKIHKYKKHLERYTDIKKYDIIHAHSLYTDGGVAYLLNQKYGIPYIVAVRSADTATFMKFFPHLKPFAREILQNAEKVIFITPSLKNDTIHELYQNRSHDFLNTQSEIIPNGINEYWINNICKKAKRLDVSNKIGLIQVSRLKKQKNIDSTIRAVSILRNNGIDTTLDILGEGEDRELLEQLVEELSLKECVHFHGFISDLSKIRHFYQKNNIFIMPSNNETFGITYIEAMSQGLPIIGIKGTGVSDFFANKNIGIFVQKPDQQLICDAIQDISMNYSERSQECIDSVAPFNWRTITERYYNIYDDYAKK